MPTPTGLAPKRDAQPVPALLDLILPTPCGGCGILPEAGTPRRSALACPACRAEIDGPLLVRQVPINQGGLTAVAATRYSGAARQLVVALKDGGRPALAGVLGPGLRRAVRALDPSVAAPVPAQTLVLVPVPSRAAARRARGYDHALLLARAASRGTWPVARLVGASSARQDQAGLSRADRAANVAGAFRLVGRPPLGPVVLVDDVLTTGASVRAAADLLIAAGVVVLGAAVVTGVEKPAGT